MLRLILARLLQSIVALLVVSIIVFLLARVVGDPIGLMLGGTGTQEDVERIKQELGLDKPLLTQYWIFISDAVKGDFGNSVITHRPAFNMTIERLGNSLLLVTVSMIIALLFGIPLGVYAAVYNGGVMDKFTRVLAALGQALPTFIMGLVFIELFSVRLRILPSSGSGSWQHLVLPSFCLGLFMVAGILRLVRSSMLDIFDSEFIKLAKIKGVSQGMIIWKHAFRNSLLSVVSFVGVYFAVLVSGSIVVESVFAWPGFGQLAYSSLLNRDFPVIQVIVLVATALVLVVNLLTDILYFILDPRIRSAS